MGSRYLVTCDWSEAPHLTAEAKADLYNSIPGYQRQARSKGIPALGAGAIFPIPDDEIRIADFQIPAHWPRGYGLDVGFVGGTAAAWIAHDRETDVRYIYNCYMRAEAEPAVHVAAIQARGKWIPGRIDPAAHGKSQLDGQRLSERYTALGLILENAENAVEAGLFEMFTLFTTGRLKVFASCTQFFAQFRLYRRDEKGKVVKRHDHLMDATRYAVASGVAWLKTQPPDPKRYVSRSAFQGGPQSVHRGWSS